MFAIWTIAWYVITYNHICWYRDDLNVLDSGRGGGGRHAKLPDQVLRAGVFALKWRHHESVITFERRNRVVGSQHV